MYFFSVLKHLLQLLRRLLEHCFAVKLAMNRVSDSNRVWQKKNSLNSSLTRRDTETLICSLNSFSAKTSGVTAGGKHLLPTKITNKLDEYTHIQARSSEQLFGSEPPPQHKDELLFYQVVQDVVMLLCCCSYLNHLWEAQFFENFLYPTFTLQAFVWLTTLHNNVKWTHLSVISHLDRHSLGTSRCQHVIYLTSVTMSTLNCYLTTDIMWIQ